MTMTRDFKRALVTGAASGIGRAFVQRLAGEGTAVGLIDIVADALEDSKKLAEKAGVAVQVRACAPILRASGGAMVCID